VVPVYYFGIVGVAPFKVPSKSMEPTLLPGDFIFAVPKNVYDRGDIVVLRDPTAPGNFIVKRIVGMPGDTVSIDSGYVSINAKYASEPYISEPINYILDPVTVPDGDVFILGDNRNESEDSSRWLIDPDTGKALLADTPGSRGPDGRVYKRTVPLKSIIGKVAYLYLPFGRMGLVASYPLTNTDGE
jgi:signal peptidase I